ncbi:MAG TPA: class I SAM-dependent methyltransferase [Acidobacteriaceae bacterium]|jgi:2-polyprenyl-3-methyl-5-hydroxy-6-metoxy-1,4-benzoquinol methylase|nr:class I SAM-dependent methyltransferase [Acidobacteriaceae bacterium]
MTGAIAELDYATKPASYFTCLRPEMLPFIPASCRRLLDVGCAEGTFGDSLKRARGIEVWGVEPTRSAAASARTKLDNVIEGMFGPETALPAGSFDCVLFNDVLEHMLAPEAALRYARSLLAPGGVVVASIPNVRSFPTVWQLICYGRWEYQDCGVLDKTHFRFFTKSSIVKMFAREGLAVENICGINADAGVPNVRRRVWMLYRLVNALFLGRFRDMRFQQFAVVAKPSD